MSTRALETSVWRRHRWLWIAPLLLLVANVVLLVGYRLRYADRADIADAAVADIGARLENVRQQEETLASLVERARASRDGIQRLYDEAFATERERLTALIREVKELSERAGLRPDTISYPEEELDDYGLIKRSIHFTVEGSYENLRRFINFLELSESFLTLESVQVAETQSGLRINLQLSTLFTGRDAVLRDERSRGPEASA